MCVLVAIPLCSICSDTIWYVEGRIGAGCMCSQNPTAFLEAVHTERGRNLFSLDNCSDFFFEMYSYNWKTDITRFGFAVLQRGSSPLYLRDYQCLLCYQGGAIAWVRVKHRRENLHLKQFQNYCEPLGYVTIELAEISMKCSLVIY